MARIRSLKPSFWTDERVIGLSRDARLLCIGMISHADDAGRLLATPVRLAGDIFPADDLSTKQVLRWRDEIEQTGLIKVYKVRGVEYACFPKWRKHQRISKPQPSTLPSPEQEDTETRNDSAPKRGTDPGTVPQQGASLARGGAHVTETGDRRQETGVPPSAGSALAPLAETGVQSLIAEWIDHVPKRPPGNVIGQIGKQLRAMADEGIELADLRRGLAEWVDKGLHPSTLPSVVNEVMNRSAARASPNARPATTDLRVAQAQALKALYPDTGPARPPTVRGEITG